ncbi:MAG: type II toxin-antitoxin system PemK/MazF family toxin [Prochloraceae cyanobacterium]|nr:type II toxin-antitoxin system PemK/MazF family toxin [Prochloraceae cyanobacterium]
MIRGEVYDARLDPIEGSEQGGNRPIIIVSRDTINQSSPLIIGVPCTTYRPNRRIYPSQIVIIAPEGGFDKDTIALGEQLRAISKTRLMAKRGNISPQILQQLNRALSIALDLL